MVVLGSRLRRSPRGTPTGAIGLPATGRQDGAVPRTSSPRPTRGSDLYRRIEAFDLWFTIRPSPLTGLGFGQKFLHADPAAGHQLLRVLGVPAAQLGALDLDQDGRSSGSSSMLFLFARAVQLGRPVGARGPHARAGRDRSSPVSRTSSCSSSSPTSTSPGAPAARCSSAFAFAVCADFVRGRTTSTSRVAEGVHTAPARVGRTVTAVTARSRCWRRWRVRRGRRRVRLGRRSARRSAPAGRPTTVGRRPAPSTGARVERSTRRPPPADGATSTVQRRRRARGRCDQPAHPRPLEHADAPTSCDDAGHHAEQLGRQPVDPLQLRDRARVEPRRRLRVPQHQLRQPTATRPATFLDDQRRGRRRRAASPCPTLGWVARNDDDAHVLVPRRCRRVPAGERGRQLPQRRRPGRRSRTWPTCESTPEAVADWVAGLVADGLDPRHRRHGQRARAVGHRRTTTSTRSARRTRRSSTST